MAQYKNLIGIVQKSKIRQRLDKSLAILFPDYSRSRIKQWIINSLVKVDKKIINTPSKKIFGGELIEIQACIEEVTHLEAQNIPLNIIYEDDDLLVINKPRNLIVHPGAGNSNGTLLNALLYYFPPIINVPRAGIVHRLDKDTVGLMIIAKTIQAQTKLVASLQARKIIREYEAIVIGTLTTNGVIEQPIARHNIKRTYMAVHPMGKPAITHYHIIEKYRAHTHLRLRLETGRTHQIRVHMAHINHPLVGDPLYGRLPKSPKWSSTSLKEALHNFNRQALHAAMLRIYHPITSVEMEWRAQLPQDMLSLIAELKIDAEMCKDHMV